MNQHIKDLYNYLDDKKCEHICAYDLTEENQQYDFICIATVADVTTNKALALTVMQDFEMKEYPEGYHKGEWIIFDFERCVLHLFVEATREKYNLDKLWQSKKMAI